MGFAEPNCNTFERNVRLQRIEFLLKVLSMLPSSLIFQSNNFELLYRVFDI